MEALAKKLNEAREELSKLVLALQLKIHSLQTDAMPAIKRAVNKAAAHQSALSVAIDTSRQVFTRPRTYTLHGIKFGLQKDKGRIEIPDPERTVQRIQDLAPNYDLDSALHLHTKITPNKEAIATLPAATLKLLGCHISDATDRIIIKPTDGAVDKIVNALLAEAVDQATEAEAA